MYLKEIIINGFKSYKLQTVVKDLDPKHNVVVGRNGSGKSNFFSAIEFVLSDEYNNLRPAQRVGLINKGPSKTRSGSAFVEIVLHQSSSTSHNSTSAQSELRIRRTISATKDQYTLNGRNATRKEVEEVLESVGLSSCNPYYIVKQGKVNQFTTARPRQLLQLLFEIGGIRVYNEKLKEILRLWQDADKALQQIYTERSSIAKRLEQLSTEQKEQKKHEQLEKKHRILQFIVLEKKQQSARQALDALGQAGQQWKEKQSKLLEQKKEALHRANDLKQAHKHNEKELANALQQKSNLAEEYLRLDRQKTVVDLKLEDLHKELRREVKIQESDQGLLEKHNEEIGTLQAKLEAVSRECSNVKERQHALEAELLKKKQLRNERLNKVRRGQQFSTREERDAFLQQEIVAVSKQLEREMKTLEELRKEHMMLSNDLDGEKQQNERDRADLKQLTEKEQMCHTNLTRISTRLQEAKVVLHEFSANETHKKLELNRYKAEKSDQEQAVRRLIGAGTFHGAKSVRTALRMLEAQGTDSCHVVQGYHGRVLELLQCDDRLHPAVETIAAGKLFHHVVETDAVANALIALCTKHKLPGEYNFMPLNRLVLKRQQYPEDDSVTPLISMLTFDARYEAVFQHIFGKTLLCDTMETAVRATRQYSLNCVTYDGDMVRSGVLSGGYRAPTSSKIHQQRLLNDLCTKINQLNQGLHRIVEDASKTVTLINSLETEQTAQERTLERLRQSEKSLKDHIRAFPERYRQREERCAEKESKIRTLETELELLAAKKDSLKREFSTQFICVLSEEDIRVIEQLDAEIRALEKEKHDAFNSQLQTNQAKTKIENRLNTILIPKRDALIDSLGRMKCKELKEQVLQCKTDQDTLTAKINALQQKAKSNEQFIVMATEKGRQLASKLERVMDKLKTIEESITIGDPKQLLHEARKRDLENEIGEYAKQIGALGVLPAVDRVYSTMDLPKLLKELDKTGKQMSKFSCVNKTANDTYMKVSQELKSIDRKLKQLEESRKLQQASIQQLREQRADSLERTFADVNRNFGEIFTKLVPSGSGKLNLQTAKTADNGEGEMHELQLAPLDSEMEQYVGIQLHVSFSGKGEQMREMNALSGGQKTLVAIALLFAIQRNKPAPFYLFDEIDQALDGHHREVIANEIAVLSANSQFITVTFRRELLNQADKYLGVRYRNNMSFIDEVTKQEAYDFIVDSTIHS
uniref:Structural maintenance of chromosomes protein n=1 Tax=Anopheles epiroticus TaxID=199890 RepID=A0A182PJG0_9DIPT